MTKLSRLLLAAAVAAAFTGVSNAQETTPAETPAALSPISVGVLGGWGQHFYYGKVDIGEDPTFGGGNCGVFETGAGSGLAFGLFGEYRLSPALSIGARILREQSSGDMTTAAPGATDYSRPDGSLIAVESDYKFGIDLPTIALELYGSFHPFDLPLTLTLGPKIGLAAASEYTLREELSQPEDLRFRNGSRTREFGRGSLGGGILFGGLAGLGLPLKMSRTLELIPEVTLSGYVNSFSPSGTALDASARGSLSVRYTFPGPAPIKPPPPPPEPVAIREPEPEPPPEPPLLTVEVEGYGVTPAGELNDSVLVQVEERIRSRELPLLPYVFFDAGSSEIPARYRDGRSSSGAGDALAGYYDLLRIVGERMAARPTEKLTLVGTNSGSPAESANGRLARVRAEAVKEYLTGNFGIDPARITTTGGGLPARASNSSRPEGEEENRRVELVGSETLLAHTVIADTTRSFSSPGVRLTNNVAAEADVAAWGILLDLNGQPLRRLSGEEIVKPTFEEKFEGTELERLARGGSLGYVMEVHDKAGQKLKTERRTLPIDVRRSRTEAPLETTSQLGDLVIFDFNSAELRPESRAALARLRSRLPAGRPIRIIGFADETGDREYNRRLSLARARAVAAALRLPETAVEAADENEILYPNDRPEGRFYSRAVRMEIGE